MKADRQQGKDQAQEGAVLLVDLCQATELFRIYSPTLVPGLLQTQGYAAGVLGISARFHDVPIDDSCDAARARVERSRIIHEPGHRFFVVIEEAALHYQVSAWVRITQPSEIALYLCAFEELRTMAVYGAEARALMVRAVEL